MYKSLFSGVQRTGLGWVRLFFSAVTEEAHDPTGFVATQPQAPPTIAVCSPEGDSRDGQREFIQSGVRTGASK